jgi:F-type H+-transporting ATPase subunit b
MRRVLLLTALAVTLPTVAMAASSSAVPVTGMPQLAFGHPEQGRLLVGQAVWLLLIFAALYFLMARIVLPRVGAVIEARHARIAADLDAAQAAKAAADAALAEQRARTEAARDEARRVIAEAMQASQAEAETRAAALNERLNREIAEAEARIEAARAAALGAIREVAIETAEALVARLVGRADRAVVERAVAETLAEGGRA